MRAAALSLSFALVLASACRAEDSDKAKQLFQKCQDKLLSLKSFQVKATASLEAPTGKVSVEASIVVAQKNLAHVEIKRDDGKGLDVIANGHKMRDKSKPASATAWPAASRDVLLVFVAEGATSSLYENCFLEAKEGKLDLGNDLLLTDFRMAAREKVGDRDAQAITYGAKTRGALEEYAVTLWIDVETFLPLKRQGKITHRDQVSSFDESYTDVKVDEAVDPASLDTEK